MAVTGPKKDDSLNLPKSTGAVEYEAPKSPDPIDPEKAGESTGAVEYESPNLGDVENDATGDSEVRFETPKEPVTMTTGWLSESQAKQVAKQHKKDAEASTAGPRKSEVAETPGDDGEPERKSGKDPADPDPADEKESDEQAREAARERPEGGEPDAEDAAAAAVTPSTESEAPPAPPKGDGEHRADTTMIPQQEAKGSGGRRKKSEE